LIPVTARDIEKYQNENESGEEHGQRIAQSRRRGLDVQVTMFKMRMEMISVEKRYQLDAMVALNMFMRVRRRHKMRVAAHYPERREGQAKRSYQEHSTHRR